MASTKEVLWGGLVIYREQMSIKLQNTYMKDEEGGGKTPMAISSWLIPQKDGWKVWKNQKQYSDIVQAKMVWYGERQQTVWV